MTVNFILRNLRNNSHVANLDWKKREGEDNWDLGLLSIKLYDWVDYYEVEAYRNEDCIDGFSIKHFPKTPEGKVEALNYIEDLKIKLKKKFKNRLFSVPRG